MREWLRLQGALLACIARLLAAAATGNLEAIASIERDVNALGERWHGHG